MENLLRGKMKWFNDRKGFGFIEAEGELDIFVHHSVIEEEGYRSADEGEVVYYELKHGSKGPYASRVVRTHLNEKSSLAKLLPFTVSKNSSVIVKKSVGVEEFEANSSVYHSDLAA